MDDLSVSTERRDFLGSMAFSAAVAGLAVATANPSPALAADAPVTPFTRWLDSIAGTQRLLLDVREPVDGLAFAWAWVYLLTGAQAYGIPESELGTVMVFRHNGLPFAFEDAMWKKYKLGEHFKINNPVTKEPAVRNPHNLKSDPPLLPDMAMQKLIDRGVKVAVCDMAIHVHSGIVAKEMGLKHEEVKKEWMEATLPKIVHVPSGIVAIQGAVSRGCSYVYAG